MDLSHYLNEEFDDRAVAPSTGVPEPVPPGEYLMQMEKGEITYTKNGLGVLFKARFVIIDGDYSGRAVFAQYNIRNQNQQAQMIGISEMKALAVACQQQWEDVRTETDLLLYKPFEARLGMEREQMNPDTGKPFAPRNRILKYSIALAGSKPSGPALESKATPTKPVLPASAKDKWQDEEAPF